MLSRNAAIRMPIHTGFVSRPTWGNNGAFRRTTSKAANPVSASAPIPRMRRTSACTSATKPTASAYGVGRQQTARPEHRGGPVLLVGRGLLAELLRGVGGRLRCGGGGLRCRLGGGAGRLRGGRSALLRGGRRA